MSTIGIFRREKSITIPSFNPPHPKIWCRVRGFFVAYVLLLIGLALLGLFSLCY